MRFRFRRRRRQGVRGAPVFATGAAPAGVFHVAATTANTTTVSNTTLTGPNYARERLGAEPSPRELTSRERKLYRVSTKREHRTAGQLAVRANLASSDGSGRGVVRDLNALVKAGKLIRHRQRDHNTYTRA